MTDLSSWSLPQLAQILSALEDTRRNPNSKSTALKAIERNAAAIGLGADDVLAASAGLLDGRLSPAQWCATLAADAHPGAAGIEAATGAAGPDRDAPSAATAALEAASDGSERTAGSRRNAAPSVKQLLLAACQAAARVLHEHEIAADTLHLLRTAIARAEERLARAGAPKRSRGDSKQARLITMLQRGATISEMTRELGWLRHTCHGALAGLKKRGLTIVSDRPAGGERVYRIDAPATPAKDPARAA